MPATRRGNVSPEQIVDHAAVDGNVPVYDNGVLVDSGETPTSGSGGSGGLFLYPIDIPPSTPDAMDDEFPGSSLDAKWTKWNEQAGQSITIDQGRAVFVTPYTVQKRIYAITQPISGSSWKFRASVTMETHAWQYFGFGLLVRRTTGADKSLIGGYINGLGSEMMTGYFHRLSGADPTVDFEANLYNVVTQQLYLELEYDGTNLIWRDAKTGVIFSRMRSEATATHLGGAPEFVGFGVHAYSNFTSDPDWAGVASLDWFRRIS